MMFWASTLLVASGLVMSARAQNNVYAVEFNTGNNRFGIINLMNGSFTEISVWADDLQRHCLCARWNLVWTLQQRRLSGDVRQNNRRRYSRRKLNVPGIESIAFRPSDGTLFGWT